MEEFLLLPDRDRLFAVALAFLPRLLGAILVAALFWVGFKIVKPTLRGALTRAHFAPALVHLLLVGLL
jgi:hypothetical protein